MAQSPHAGPVNRCQICAGSPLDPILSLGHQPIVQAYLAKKQLQEPEFTYPLHLVLCSRCGLLQLDYIADPKVVFPKNYPYRTGLTNMLVRNFRSLADSMENDYPWENGDLIIDIGSNDGTLLAGFKEKGMKTLGVEPTDAAKVANKNGITTIQEYFSAESVPKIRSKFGTAKIITATNVFAHILDAPGLMRNIKNLLASDGVFVSESQYLLDIVEKLEFDTVYHEHLRFYSLKPLMRLFASQGCSLVDAERISAAGGSIRAYAKKGKRPMSARAKKLLAAEVKAGIHSKTALKKFANRVIAAKHNLLSLLIACKKRGRIAGLGSAARSNTLLGFSHIDDQLLDYACEKKGSPKIGLYTPGTHIPVVDEAKLHKDQPEYLLIMSWHIGEELVKIVKKNGYKGKCIVPLPEPKIL